MLIVERSRIEEVLAGLDLLPLIEDAFIDYSAGRAIVPTVEELPTVVAVQDIAIATAVVEALAAA